MTAGPGSQTGLIDGLPSTLQIARSARVLGQARLGDGALLAAGTVVRSVAASVEVGAGSAVLENSVVVGTPAEPAIVGRRTVFGHRCVIVGATVGDLCEIGNASVLMPGARLGNRVFLGEGTLVAPNTVLPDDVVAVGRPARIVRAASDADYERLRNLRGGDVSLPPASGSMYASPEELLMGELYAYRGILPTIAPTATLFATAEITGDVVVGDRTIIGAGVKIIGDSHGPVRIGSDVQILENTVLHLLPDNELVIGDGTIVGPATMLHGCHIGARSIVEPGAIVCDGAVLGAGCVVRAGAVVKQRSQFETGTEIDGLPARAVGKRAEPWAAPTWAFRGDDLPGR